MGAPQQGNYPPPPVRSSLGRPEKTCMYCCMRGTLSAALSATAAFSAALLGKEDWRMHADIGYSCVQGSYNPQYAQPPPQQVSAPPASARQTPCCCIENTSHDAAHLWHIICTICCSHRDPLMHAFPTAANAAAGLQLPAVPAAAAPRDGRGPVPGWRRGLHPAGKSHQLFSDINACMHADGQRSGPQPTTVIRQSRACR